MKDLNEKYSKTVESWGVPHCFHGILRTFLKMADQATPMMMHRYIGKLGLGLSLIGMLSLVVAFFGGFVYVLAKNYPCTGDCLSCSISVDGTSDSSAYTTCSPLATNSLEVRAGCLSLPLTNSYSNINTIILEGQKLLATDIDDLADDTVNHITKHLDLWKCFEKNSQGQVTDAKVPCIKEWATGANDETNRGAWMGASDSYDLLGKSETDASYNKLTDAAWVAYANKALYSSISLTCLLHSVSNDMLNDDTTSSINSSVSFTPVQAGYRGGDYFGDGNDIDYTIFNGCGCSISCPGDAVAGTSSPEITLWEGLGSFSIALPTKYFAMSQNEYEEAGDQWLTFEAVRGDTGQHCTDSIYSSAPSSLETGSYECCTSKTFSATMAEANAFGGLCMTVMVVVDK